MIRDESFFLMTFLFSKSFLSYFDFLKSTLTCLRSMSLLLFMSSSSAALITAVFSWIVKYPCKQAYFTSAHIFWLGFFSFLLTYFFLPWARTRFVLVFAASPLAQTYKYFDKVLGLTTPGTLFAFSFIYISSERSSLALHYWDQLGSAFDLLFFVSAIRVFVILPATIGLNLERLLAATPSLSSRKKTENFFYMVIPESGRAASKVASKLVPLVEEALQGSKNLSKGLPVPPTPPPESGLATAAKIGGGALALGTFLYTDGGSAMASYKESLTHSEDIVRTGIERNPKFKTIGEQELEKLHQLKQECRDSSIMVEGGSRVYLTLESLVTGESSATNLQKKVDAGCDSAGSFASKAVLSKK